MNLPVPAQPSAKPSLNLRGSARLLTVFAFSLFLLINTSVTRVVLRGSLLLFFLSLSPGRSSHLFSRQVFKSSLLRWKKKIKKGGRGENSRNRTRWNVRLEWFEQKCWECVKCKYTHMHKCGLICWVLHTLITLIWALNSASRYYYF